MIASFILAALLAIHPAPVNYVTDGVAYVDVDGETYTAWSDDEADNAIIINGQCIVW